MLINSCKVCLLSSGGYRWCQRQKIPVAGTTDVNKPPLVFFTPNGGFHDVVEPQVVFFTPSDG